MYKILVCDDREGLSMVGAEYSPLNISKILSDKEYLADNGRMIRALYLPLGFIFIPILILSGFDIKILMFFATIAVIVEVVVSSFNLSSASEILSNISLEMKKRDELKDDDLIRLWKNEDRKQLALIINRICNEFADWNHRYRFLPDDSFSIMTGKIESRFPNEHCLKVIEDLLNVRFPESTKLKNISFGNFVDLVYKEKSHDIHNIVGEIGYRRIKKSQPYLWRIWLFRIIRVAFVIYFLVVAVLYYVMGDAIKENGLNVNFSIIALSISLLGLLDLSSKIKDDDEGKQ